MLRKLQSMEYKTEVLLGTHENQNTNKWMFYYISKTQACQKQTKSISSL